MRGVMLGGIALMNIGLFTASMQTIDNGIDPNLHGLSWWADALVYTLLHEKGWVLFSMMFGVGFAVMRQQARTHGSRFVRVWMRRAAVLLLIGLIHAVLIWPGDILTSYAMAAVLLLLLARNLSAKHTAILGACLMAMPLTIVLLSAADAWAHGTTALPHAAAAARHQAAEVAALAHGTYGQATAERLSYLLGTFRERLQFLPLILGSALMGVALYDVGAFSRPEQHRRLWKRILTGGLGAGLGITAVSLMIDASPNFTGPTVEAHDYMASILQLLGSLPLAMAYAALVMLASLTERGGRWLRHLAPMGRLALTNYLVQSLIATTLFYGYGFGLWGEVSRFGQVAIALLVFAMQVRWSRWYVERFRYGPAEWLWRWGTYGVRPAFRGSPTAAEADGNGTRGSKPEMAQISAISH
ncbi:MAG: DUF418 domain-containing protein [Proteobacteria bacterium]|nr:DUF418 domain-containing protein [Pseudomonadota bacterium]